MITDAQKLEAWKDRMCQKCRCGAKKPQGHPFCVRLLGEAARSAAVCAPGTPDEELQRSLL
jgi:hypothetical protein